MSFIPRCFRWGNFSYISPWNRPVPARSAPSSLPSASRCLHSPSSIPPICPAGTAAAVYTVVAFPTEHEMCWDLSAVLKYAGEHQLSLQTGSLRFLRLQHSTARCHPGLLRSISSAGRLLDFFQPPIDLRPAPRSMLVSQTSGTFVQEKEVYHERFKRVNITGTLHKACQLLSDAYSSHHFHLYDVSVYRNHSAGKSCSFPSFCHCWHDCPPCSC